MQACERAMALAEGQGGGVLLLEGDVGVGKSRLLQELRCSTLGGTRKQAGSDGQLSMFSSGGDPLHRSRVSPMLEG